MYTGEQWRAQLKRIVALLFDGSCVHAHKFGLELALPCYHMLGTATGGGGELGEKIYRPEIMISIE
jgi:hypothetical protein